MTAAPAQSGGTGSAQLSAADLERARQIAASAPPLTPEARERLRAILAGCIPAVTRLPGAIPPQPDRGGDDVAA